MENNEIKKSRGRPRTKTPKEKKPKGRPRKHEHGYDDTRASKTLVDKIRYRELLEIEQKYLKIKNI